MMGIPIKGTMATTCCKLLSFTIDLSFCHTEILHSKTVCKQCLLSREQNSSETKQGICDQAHTHSSMRHSSDKNISFKNIFIWSFMVAPDNASNSEDKVILHNKNTVYYYHFFQFSSLTILI